MERMGNRKGVYTVFLSLKSLNGDFNGRTFPGNDGLLCTVFVGGNHIAWNFIQNGLNLCWTGRNGCHLPRVINFDTCHFSAARTNGYQCVFEWHDFCRHCGCVFSQRVSSHHVSFDSVGLKQPHNGNVYCQCGGL